MTAPRRGLPRLKFENEGRACSFYDEKSKRSRTNKTALGADLLVAG